MKSISKQKNFFIWPDSEDRMSIQKVKYYVNYNHHHLA